MKKAIYAPWRDHYIAYDELKGIIKVLSQHGIEAMSPNMSYKEFAPSLSVSQVQEADFQVTYEGKELSEEYFFVVLDTNLAKVSDFIKRQMKMVLQRARELEVQAAGAKEAGEEKRQKIITQSKSLGEEFLRLEKFVNVNYTGFHKILKKHDKQVREERAREGERVRERETHIPGSRGIEDVGVQCYVSVPHIYRQVLLQVRSSLMYRTRRRRHPS